MQVAIKEIEDYRQAFEADPSAHHVYVRQARVRQLKDNKVLISWSVSPLHERAQQVDKSILGVFKALGCDIRTGAAPPLPLERKMQEHIQELSRALGHDKGKGKGKGSDTAF